jgi:hypothetical protein
MARTVINHWYIEAREGEAWASVSGTFVSWLKANVKLDSFGFCDGDPVTLGGKSFLCFEFPAHHGEKIGLFARWAKSTTRIYGGAERGRIHFSDGQALILPSRPTGPIPPWLR